MTDHPIIATPHGVEAVEAVLTNHTKQTSVGPVTLKDAWLVIHLDGERTFHDTDPRIEPTEKVHPVFPEGWHRFSECHTMTWTVGKEPKDTRYCTRPRDHEGSCGDWFHEDTLPRKRQLSYPVTLAGKPYTLVGEWVEVE